MRIRVFRSLLLALAVGVVACATRPSDGDAPAAPATTDAPVASAEPAAEPPTPAPTDATAPAGADPKINAPYLDPALDVDAWTNRFEGESREVYRAREALVATLGLKPGMTVADVGTGTGLFVKYLADAVGPTGRVIATDIAAPFLARVQARADAAGLTQVETRLGGADDTRLPHNAVDLVFMSDVYHHFEAPGPILASIHAALRPGGRLAIVDYHRIPGVSSDFILGHVRADRATVVAEIEAAGFRKLPDPPAPFLEENYLVVFEPLPIAPDPGASGSPARP